MFLIRSRPSQTPDAGRTGGYSPVGSRVGNARISQIIRCARRLAFSLALAATTCPALAQEALGRFEEEKGASRIELTGVFDPPPPSGFQPVRVRVTNATGEKRRWQLDFVSEVGWNRGGQTRSTFEVAADPGGQDALLLVPMHAAVTSGRGSYSGGQHQWRLTATGNRNTRHVSSTHSQRVQALPAIAISDALAIKNLTQLNDAAGTTHGRGYSHEKLFGSRFAPDALPDHWLGFSGFDHIMITSDEWLALAPGVRTAIMQSIQFGMHLHLYRPNDAVNLASLGLAGAANDATALAYGMGKVELESWDGDTLDPAATVSKFGSFSSQSQVNRLSQEYATGSWGLERALGGRNFAGWQVIIFLLVFGVMIGPVNLFLLAPAGRRHRLFFTTPAISLAASAMLVALILWQDGTGGAGRRFIAVHLPPGEPAAYVTQEQISRTGVVLGSGFSLPRPGFIAQTVLPKSQWAKFSSDHESQSMDARIDGTRVGGNWFQSRTVQGQVLRSVVPTRGRIEIVPPTAADAPPAVLSSLDVELTSFFYRDPDGANWRTDGPVLQGRPVPLVKDSENWTTRWNAIRERPSPSLSTRIDSIVHPRPAFLATAATAPGFAIDTLPSIRWQDDTIVFFGSLPVTP